MICFARCRLANLLRKLDRKQPWPCYLSAWWVFTHRFLENFRFKKQLESGNQWIQHGYAWRVYNISRWWFHFFLIFTPTWGNDPIGLIFFKWVKTTNYIDLDIYIYTIHIDTCKSYHLKRIWSVWKLAKCQQMAPEIQQNPKPNPPLWSQVGWRFSKA